MPWQADSARSTVGYIASSYKSIFIFYAAPSNDPTYRIYSCSLGAKASDSYMSPMKRRQVTDGVADSKIAGIQIFCMQHFEVCAGPKYACLPENSSGVQLQSTSSLPLARQAQTETKTNRLLKKRIHCPFP
jgi:hypothetical protein